MMRSKSNSEDFPSTRRRRSSSVCLITKFLRIRCASKKFFAFLLRESNCFLVPSVYVEKHDRMIQLKATKEEYLKNLREMASESELHRKLLAEEEEESAQEEFEVLAAGTEERTTQVRFSEIVESSAS